MPASYDIVRRLALALPGVVEGNSYGTPSLHVGRGLLGRLREDGETVVLKVDRAERERLCAAQPDVFFYTDHYRSSALVLINLLAVREAELPALVEAAWRMVAPPRLVAAYDQAQAPSAGRTSPTRAPRSATTRSKAR